MRICEWEARQCPPSLQLKLHIILKMAKDWSKSNDLSLIKVVQRRVGKNCSVQMCEALHYILFNFDYFVFFYCLL